MKLWPWSLAVSLFVPVCWLLSTTAILITIALAFPVLRSHAAQAVFFLTTSFVGTNHVPWWDVIAYIIKNSRKDVIQLQYPERIEFDLRRQGLNEVIMRTLQLYKRPDVKLQERFIQELETACESSAPSSNAARCFMNWDEAREMQHGGMAFGSHTHTHEILSKLPVERQLEEARQSRETPRVAVKSSGGRACISGWRTKLFYSGNDRSTRSRAVTVQRSRFMADLICRAKCSRLISAESASALKVKAGSG